MASVKPALLGPLGLLAFLGAAQLPVSSLLPPTPGPVPTATPVPVRMEAGERTDLLASLEIEQGGAVERIGLFKDGTAVRIRTVHGGRHQTRRRVSAEERDLVVRVAREAASVPPDRVVTGLVGRGSAARRFRLEVVTAAGETRAFAFDELTPLPLAVGRARAALEDLAERLTQAEGRESGPWDASALKEKDRLRRRSDGRWFVVDRDDRLAPYLELLDVERRLERMVLTRVEVPKVFEDPSSEEGRDGAPVLPR